MKNKLSLVLLSLVIIGCIFSSCASEPKADIVQSTEHSLFDLSDEELINKIEYNYNWYENSMSTYSQIIIQIYQNELIRRELKALNEN